MIQPQDYLHVGLVKACMDSYPPAILSAVHPLNLLPLLLSLRSCCRQTINQCFVGWMAHIHCSCCAQQKGKINKERAQPLN